MIKCKTYWATVSELQGKSEIDLCVALAGFNEKLATLTSERASAKQLKKVFACEDMLKYWQGMR